MLKLTSRKLLVVEGVCNIHGTFSTFFDDKFKVDLERTVNCKVYLLFGVELCWKLVVEGQEDYLLIINAYSD